jgi:hypothetical protein
MDIYGALDTNQLYRQTFRKSHPPIPEEVLSWDIGLQELFCALSIAHYWMGREEADRLAIEQVKKSEWFVLWGRE